MANNKHNLRKHPLYSVWGGFKTRCDNPNNEAYPHYGGRGITYHKPWEEFIVFYTWAMANGYKEGLSLDRKNNDLGYTPENCRFVDVLVQNQNTRLIRCTNTSGYRGVTKGKSVSRDCWRASIRHNGSSKIWLGTFNTKEEAALAYDNYVIKHNLHQPLNFPDRLSITEPAKLLKDHEQIKLDAQRYRKLVSLSREEIIRLLDLAAKPIRFGGVSLDSSLDCYDKQVHEID